MRAKFLLLLLVAAGGRSAWAQSPQAVGVFAMVKMPVRAAAFDPNPAASSPRRDLMPALTQVANRQHTPFASQVSFPVARLLGGKLELAGIERRTSMQRVYEGPAANASLWHTVGSMRAARTETFRGIQISLSFGDACGGQHSSAKGLMALLSSLRQRGGQ